MKKLLVVLLALVLCLAALVACGDKTPEVTYDAAAAATYVFNLYKDKGPVTASDFDVTAKVQVSGVSYDVEWTATEGVTITKKDDNTYTVDINEKTAEAYEYTLTATVKAGDGTTAKKDFKFSVPKYEIMSFEQYMAAAEGDNVTIEGIVVAINSKAAGNTRNHLFLADANVVGGYYSYQMDADPVADLGIEIGMTVSITGPVAPYSGMQEIKGGVAKIVSAEKKEYAPVDITDKFAAGESLKNYVGLPVTIKGVEIAGQELGGTSDYLKFKLGEVTSYIRTYVTDFPTTLKAEDKTTIDEAHAAKFGYSANVTGILVLYNNAPYLIPMTTDCFEYLEKVEKTPEQKIEAVLGELTLPTTINKAGELAAPATGTAYPEVTLTWASNNENVVVADGKLTITVPNTAVEVTITVTATCGDKTDTKEFKITLTKLVDPNTFLTLPQANEIGIMMGHNTYTEGKYFVTGTIKSIEFKKGTEDLNDYGNMTIEDADGNTFYLYGLYSVDGAVRFDKMNPQPKVGDTITVYGILGQYNGTAQMKNAWLVATPAADSEVTVVGANTIGLAQGHNKYTADKYVVTGEITEIANDKYGNIYIKDAKGNTFYLYGLYSADGEVRYDKMETKPAVGDTITVSGILGQYNGAAQMKNAWLVSHTPATPDEGGDEGGETPAPAGNTVDMPSFSLGDGKDTSYTARTNSQGWAAENSAIITGKEYNGAETWAITLNGKTSAPGKLTSAKLTGGIKSLSFKYGFPFSDTQFKLTINIKQGDKVVATTTLEKTGLTQSTVYDFTWTLETPVEGEFTIEIINECLSNSGSNKDRLSIWNITWENK
ncbi:MAG: hypothetical protein E7625_03500 [Ruminococcaceae bacterium]|nr:hypothetical protein [Oscillospiraceae bacterium]